MSPVGASAKPGLHVTQTPSGGGKNNNRREDTAQGEGEGGAERVEDKFIEKSEGENRERGRDRAIERGEMEREK